MDTETSAKFAAIERSVRRDRKELRLQHRHLRQFLSIIVVMFSIVFSIITAGLGWFISSIHSTDRADLRDFEANLRAELLGQSEGGNLLLYGVNNHPLDGQTILVIPNEFVSADKYKPSPTWGFEFYFVVKNNSEYSSGLLHTKMFFTDPIKGQTPSSDYQDQFKESINQS